MAAITQDNYNTLIQSLIKLAGAIASRKDNTATSLTNSAVVYGGDGTTGAALWTTISGLMTTWGG